MILYKYYPSSENSYKSLAVNAFWCHGPKKMNDPFECLWLADRIFDNIDLQKFRNSLQFTSNQKLKRSLDLPDDKLIQFINEFRKKLIDSFAFCAFSETFNNILMWSHYASSHSGFVIGFDFPKSDERLYKVQYLKKLPKFNINHLSDGLLNKLENPKYIIKDLSIKSIDWKYEKEWRIWVSKPGYYQYESNQIKEIYFGINCTTETKLIVSKLATSDDPNFLFREMEFRDNPVRLEY